MGYEANSEKQRADANNANNINNLADAAIASGDPRAAAIGTGIKAADKMTGGKSTEALGKAMTKANQATPMGNRLQNTSNRMSESGASNKLGQAARLKNNLGGGGHGGPPSSGQDNSEMFDRMRKNQLQNNIPNHPEGMERANESFSDSRNRKRDSSLGSSGKDSKSSDGSSGDFADEFNGKAAIPVAMIAAIVLTPIIIAVFIITLISSTFVGQIANFIDGFGASQAAGEDVGDIDIEIVSEEESPDAQAFYERINRIKSDYASNGKYFEALYVAAVYNVLSGEDKELTYDDMTSTKIRAIVDAMFDGNDMDDETFKKNLAEKIFPKYLDKTGDYDKKDYQKLADKVYDYIDDYFELTGGTRVEYIKNQYAAGGGGNSCTSVGSCVYNIKGFYIHGKGNITKNVNFSNIYIRLMQCGTANGHNYGGTFGLPLEGEELVPLEKYVLGVAYQEIGDGASDEAFKAQMIAARSYILARPTDMGGWRRYTQEGDKLIIPAASCTQDQVYCNPDKGCSSNDGQWGQVHSGLAYSGFQRGPMDANSKHRTLAAQTQGEVLVNSSGYIVYAGYLQEEQNQFESLARSGLNYKQILLQVYNSGNRQYGASDIVKMSCTDSSGSSCTGANFGDAASWKQTDPRWSSVPVGNSGKTVGDIGCFVTSLSILISKSGVQTNISDFNPGTFVQAVNQYNGFDQYGNYQWGPESKIAPGFVHMGQIELEGYTKEQKLQVIKDLLDQGYYVIAKVVANTHYVAVDSVNGDTIKMMDPGSKATDMWGTYGWNNTIKVHYFKANK